MRFRVLPPECSAEDRFRIAFRAHAVRREASRALSNPHGGHGVKSSPMSSAVNAALGNTVTPSTFELSRSVLWCW